MASALLDKILPTMPTAAVKTHHVCQVCGFSSPKWLGRCPSCGEWESLVEERLDPRGARRPSARSTVSVIPYVDIEEEALARLATGNKELDRTLGGGLVPGSLILLGGEPGIGKSTLLLQIADQLSCRRNRVLYVAGEESARQIRLRGDRLGVEGKELSLLAETNLEVILDAAGELRPCLLVIDSIQTVHSSVLESVPGSLAQIRECAGRLLSFAKRSQVAVFLIGHITKDGALAGPKTLEHVVDVVLYFEGERHQNQKLVRTVKNRFGPANELGVFEMSSRGLTPVDNPSRLFLSERVPSVSGSAVLCAVEGSRPVLVELQALVSQSSYSTARRMANGVDPNRVALLLAMLEKRLGLKLLGSDVFVNVAGGLSPSEPALDLPLVAAILSSLRNRPIDPDMAIFGEVGLLGEVRGVPHAQVRVKEARSLGFARVILPGANLPLPETVENIELIGISSISELLRGLDKTLPRAIQSERKDVEGCVERH